MNSAWVHCSQLTCQQLWVEKKKKKREEAENADAQFNMHQYLNEIQK